MALGNQMHMVTETAEHATKTASGTADGLNNHVRTLTGHVTGVVGSGWAMDQATAFMNAHNSWSEGMAKLVTALNKVSTDTGAAVNDYATNDEVGAAAMNKVQAPPFSGALA